MAQHANMCLKYGPLKGSKMTLFWTPLGGHFGVDFGHLLGAILGHFLDTIWVRFGDVSGEVL